MANVAKFFEDLEINSKPLPLTSENSEDTTDKNVMDQSKDQNGNCAIHKVKTTNITIRNPNIYFLCEYIVRNLNYKLFDDLARAASVTDTSAPDETPTGVTFGSPNETVMDQTSEGGNPKKSTKFKITKKHNKKQYKKRTRKYLHNLK